LQSWFNKKKIFTKPDKGIFDRLLKEKHWI